MKLTKIKRREATIGRSICTTINVRDAIFVRVDAPRWIRAFDELGNGRKRIEFGFDKRTRCCGERCKVENCFLHDDDYGGVYC